MRWEPCNVTLCPSSTVFCKTTPGGREFKGHLTLTVSGKACQSWNSQFPNPHSYTSDSMFSDGSVAIAHDRCRNPDSTFEGGPWCYTMDKTVRWELCDVKPCGMTEQGFCKVTHIGRNFQKPLSITKSGRTCQSWTSQSPHVHKFTVGTMFVDGNVALAMNYCRNPGLSMPDGPWCYTTDPKMRWEYCDVNFCAGSHALCKMTDAGREFRGNITKTKSGKDCQRWDSQTPNDHAYTLGTMYPDGSVATAGNQCRNPDSAFTEGPWCYTLDNFIKWETCTVPHCPRDKTTVCKDTEAGLTFRGNITMTKSGKTCQAWASQTPNRHRYTNDTMYPDGSAAAAGNNCRNPDPDHIDGPWCYTTDPSTPWEQCNITMCGNAAPSTLCKSTQAGRDFNGSVSVTKSGKTCQSWSQQFPQRHAFTSDDLYPDGSVMAAGNKCRNPDKSFNEGPWCFTTDPNTPWELCDIQSCGKLTGTFCRETVTGRDFLGDLRVTKSGKHCQSWSKQTPVAHNFTMDYMFPDGTVAAAGSKCRNPDPAFKGGPWCFTTDNQTRWETCEVPMCEKAVPVFCKKTPEGREFSGHLTITKCGKPCQSWAAQTPNVHSYRMDSMFPDGSVAAADNRCRNPDSSFSEGPWCYTNDTRGWEVCDVPMCPDASDSGCKLTDAGLEFMGDLRETIGGRICQSWSSQKPNAHNYTADKLFPDGSVIKAGNKCRNPDPTHTDGPWCYTNDPNIRWEQCDVPKCAKTGPSFCKSTMAGREFKGHLTVTKNGRQCQSWAAQSPNRHSFLADNLYADGSRSLADNRCRNPDPNYGTGPWCYTLDPLVPWEDCDVPMCENMTKPICKETSTGRDFKGDLRVTKNGKTCQRWDTQNPVNHTFTSDFMFPDTTVTEAQNMCRNPDPSYTGGPWCFTTDPNVKWEPCDVPMCEKAGPAFCKDTAAGREFMGHVTVTKSGKPCQSWNSQTPNRHPFNVDSLFPDGSVEIAGDRCRNPDKSFNLGPWCYTNETNSWEVCDIPLCPKQTQSFCKQSQVGMDFMGDLRETKSGRICQSWSLQSPNAHNYTDGKLYPDGSAAKAGNRCRNPDPTHTDGPWCYTNDPLVRWEQCDVPLCPTSGPAFCKETKEGREFKGQLTVTKSGKPCQSWASQSPNNHSYTEDKLFPDASVAIADNRCRNPDSSYAGGPWCYTLDTSVRWEDCDVPMCSNQTICKATQTGRDFTGDLKVSKSGKACQSWASQVPTPHNFASDFMFPDGSVAGAGSNCRNPDPQFTLGPWCFTTDPNTPWEQCDVPLCSQLTASFCKQTDAGREFKGHLTVTKSGKQCQSWGEQTPNSHEYTSGTLFPDGSAQVAGNRCRNPDDSFNEGPWCYTTDNTVRWETCDVPLCSTKTPFCKSTVSGVEFMGNLRETKAGRICQSWGSQTPNKHNYTEDRMFPDGSAILAGNRCRNPDTVRPDGPWCYTTDPRVPWEYCDIPICPDAPPSFCKHTPAGRDFKGHLTKTKNGFDCQSWNSQTPNEHSYTDGSLFADGKVSVADNRCRNPDPSFNDGPWCYTTDNKTRWDVCDVPMCPEDIKNFCKETPTGRDFTGNLRISKSGKTCQSWMSQTPYAHNFTSDFMFPDGSVTSAENKCRNPDSNFQGGPWCFTTDPDVKWEVCDVPLCVKSGPSFCKQTMAGREFRGHLTVTKTGKQCQSWAVQTPNSHSYLSDNLFPDGSARMAGNQCRNPDSTFNDGPWCYTTEPGVWELCDVPMCSGDPQSLCKKTDVGTEFAGDLRETKSGKICQSWASQSPNPHQYTNNSLYPDGSAALAGNRCRNPDPTHLDGPWCYTMDPNVRWEQCNVPLCPKIGPSFCKTSRAGREFTGHLTMTKSGKPCQSWGVQSPNPHSFTSNNLYPDGSAQAAANRCRNPDPSYTGGPWCYTLDRMMRWEECDVPMCQIPTVCKETPSGREFKGDIRMTKSGKTCQSWNSQKPNEHNFTADFMFPDGSVQLADNQCRNPDPMFNEGPWCFTTDSLVKRETCNVPLCESDIPLFCKETDAGREFNGHLSTTKSGKQCQSWDSQSPNRHRFTADNLFPDSTVAMAGDRCRNPDSAFNDGPWCYTTDSVIKWEVCDVPPCPKGPQNFCKQTEVGLEFKGNLKETKSGKICQSWSSQTPNAHNYTNDKLFSDGSVLVAGNRCRNPDPTHTDGPWCYTMDPSVRWELCNVPLCPKPSASFCKQTQAGKEFTGHLTVTKSGKPCQSWAEQSPRSHKYTDDRLYPDGSAELADNRCRNPDPTFNGGPWCYTLDPNTEWEICDVPLCPKKNQTACKETPTGRDFKGDVRVTINGKICQNWTAQNPVPHNFTSDFMFPDATVADAQNMCRNPDPQYSGGPWCFTMDPNTRWEPCDIPSCDTNTAMPDFCKQTQAGREFMGHLTVTKSGKTCQSWDSQSPQPHRFTQNSSYPDGSTKLASNRCRNPDPSFNGGPWCYTTDPAVPWEECDVPMCPSDSITLCKTTEAGLDFNGDLRETKSGKICQSWNSQIPNKHNFTQDKLFPDGSVQIAGNRSRNPDPTHTDGPWCYTMDPNTRWEQCNVPKCPEKDPTFCKVTQAGRAFVGHLTFTKSGKPCQSWAEQNPQKHQYTDDSLFPDGSAAAAANRCRNPDSSYNEGPWCYTTDPKVPWEQCDVQMCPKITDVFCKMSTAGREFRGNLTQTKSGRSCQSWSSQSPHKHNFNSSSMFPDGSAGAAGMGCRNPDPLINDGPWWFTKDPLVRWEYCEVPLCENGAPTFCKQTKAGREFRGHLTVTKSGKPCQSWATQSPNRHSYTANSLFPDGSAAVADNRCRNPDTSFNDGPWCYTMDTTTPWEVCDVPMCPAETKDYCKITPAGREFMGNVRRTKSGKTCQRWASQFPFAHDFTKDIMFPDGSIDVADNQCRNPDSNNNDGPWCFTTDPRTRMEQCDVPTCPKAIGPCKDTVAGREFLGDVNVTKSGRPCQSWAVQIPNRHSYTAFPDGSATIAANRCRNPDKSYNEGPWCYTTDPKVPWEACAIPLCPKSSSFCKTSRAGRDFKGHLTVTVSGLQCQSWNSQSPNVHGFTQDAMFPDGSVATADNRCRNPDPKFEDGPWCYTTDPNKRWELFDVPACPDVDLGAPKCRNTQAGHEFLGDVTVTKSGYECQRWDSQTPWKHTYTDDSLYSDVTVKAAGNRCRNPDPGYRVGPFCYTLNPNVEWELCDIPFCTNIESFCKTSEGGWEFTGHLTNTVSGRTCQNWNAQSPQQHEYTRDDQFPDGSVAIASNRCRNPDKTFTQGPWCYTQDPLVRWQLCDVPRC